MSCLNLPAVNLVKVVGIDLFYYDRALSSNSDIISNHQTSQLISVDQYNAH